MKKLLFFIIFASFTTLLLTNLISSETKVPNKQFSAKELAKFDGSDKKPAYVAIDGIVYDVTKFKKWAGGKHFGNLAGRDLSAKIRKAPHGVAKLKVLTPVGKFKAEKK